MASDEHPAEDVQPESAGAEAESPDSGAGDDTLPRLLAAISEQTGEIRAQLERLLDVQFDRLRLKARTGLFWLLTGLLIGAVCIVGAVAAVLYVLEGVAGLFTALFSGNVWAGNLAAGGLVLLMVVLVVLVLGGRFREKELKRLQRKYEPGSEKGKAQ